MVWSSLQFKFLCNYLHLLLVSISRQHNGDGEWQKQVNVQHYEEIRFLILKVRIYFLLHPSPLYGRVCFYKLIQTWSLKTKWECFHCSFQDQGLLSIFTCSHYSTENICVLYIFIKEKKNPYIMQFLFSSHNKQVLHFLLLQL